MTEQTEEQREMEEQAIALKWQSDTRLLRRFLKFSNPSQLSQLREAQYFAEDYVPTTIGWQGLEDIITTSFIQDLPYSEWQTSALKNTKKLLSPSQRKMLEHWSKEKKKLSQKQLFSKDSVLSSLAVARIFATLDASKGIERSAILAHHSDRPSSLLSDKALFNLVDVLPFFDETNITWTSRAQNRFQNTMALNLCRELESNASKQNSSFLLQQLMKTALRDQNAKRAIFGIDLLGKVADTLKIRLDSKSLELIVKNLQNTNRPEIAKKVKNAFHMDPVFPLARFFQKTRAENTDH